MEFNYLEKVTKLPLGMTGQGDTELRSSHQGRWTGVLTVEPIWVGEFEIFVERSGGDTGVI